MSSTINILHSQGPLTKTERFTEPLRGLLGGRKITQEADSKGKKIFNIWQRVFLGALLFTVGLPYTVTAGAILACSKKKKPIAPKSKSDAVKSPLDDRLSAKQIKILSDLFKGTKIDFNAIAVSDDVIADPANPNALKELYLNVKLSNQPMYRRFINGQEILECVTIPLEKKNLSGNAEQTILTIGRSGIKETNPWIVEIDAAELGVLPQSGEPDSMASQIVKDLLKGNVYVNYEDEYKLRYQE